MNYINGYTIKPYQVEPTGEVLFTDGTNNSIRANQQQCEAYGYTYDPVSSTCRLFQPNSRLGFAMNNFDNKIHGPGNIIGTGVTNTIINGSNNEAEGFNNNGFISGADNTIATGVKNATVVGSGGIAIREGEFVVGSNAGQTSSFALNGTTTDATSTALFVDGDTSVTTIARENDIVYFYTIDVFGYRTGGSSGSGAVKDSIFIKVEGMVDDTSVTQVSNTVANKGTTAGWSASCSVSSDNLQLKVVGAAAMNIQWQANAIFTKMIGT